MNPSQYDPISTLERQYGDRPLGRRLLVIVSLNAECFVAGGVQTVLRNSQSSSSNLMEMGGISNSSNNSNSTNHPSSQSSFADMLAAETAGTVDLATADLGSLSIAANANPEDKLKPGWGSKLAKLAKNTQQHIERKVTSMAIQAQKVNSGDAAADKLCVAAYLQNPVSGDFDACCGRTEAQEMPILSGATSDLFAMTFRVPIYIPTHAFAAAATGNHLTVQLKLWIRSGVALLSKTYFYVGQALWRVDANIWAQTLHHQQGGPTIMTVPLQSNVATGAKLTLTLVQDLKLPPLCGLGWSLSDPRADLAYTSQPQKRLLFNPPLDGTWAFQVEPNNNFKSRCLVLATERTTESTLVLPLAYAYHRLLAQAASVSCNQAAALTTQMKCLDHVQASQDPICTMQHGYAQVQFDLCYYMSQINPIKAGDIHMVSLFFQRPDSIFEKFLTSGSIPTYGQDSNAPPPGLNVAMSIPFYPKIIQYDDKRLIPSERLGPNGTRSIFLGSIRMDIRNEASIDTSRHSNSNNNSTSFLEALVHMETFLDHPSDNFVQIPVNNCKTGQVVGFIVCKLMVHMVPTNPSSDNTAVMASKEGLSSLVGMESLIDDYCYPALDTTEQSSPSEEDVKRKRQLATMGEWLHYDFMRKLLTEREKDLRDIQRRAEAYQSSVSTGNSSTIHESLPPPSKRKEPFAFRPSSSRGEMILSGIGFNIHVQNVSLSFMPLDLNRSSPPSLNPLSSCQSITCGAPADHYRGFGPKGIEGKTTSGGLRRLEAARTMAAEQIKNVQNALIQLVAQYFQAQPYQPGVRRVVKSNERAVQLRKEARSLLEYYHTLSWEIAVRRGNVFSQALGVAVTSYLTLISDVSRMQQSHWVEYWKKYGFLISFEGLLSTAGKELGMIEDASIAISMLRMVSLVLVSDDGNHSNASSSSVPVFDSTYVRWVDIIPSGTGSSRKYRVEIGIDSQYYIRLVPVPLRHGTLIQIYPIFFQMGVDVRQTIANAGMRVQATTFSVSTPFAENGDSETFEVDEDEQGAADNDILIALNMEAFQKLNAYTHCVYPVSTFSATSFTWEDAQVQSQLQRQLVHPSLSELYELIRNSSAKMEHGVLEKAGAAVMQLGGGGAIFCKSGKDRTAMQVTFKESQFINKFLSPIEASDDQVFDIATLLRLYGTRLPVCEKNVGQALFAFNALQVKFMPPELKPPSQTLAGFLKRGKLIES